MKTLKSLLKGLLVLIMVNLIGILVLSLTIQKTLVNGIIKETIKTEVLKDSIKQELSVEDNAAVEELLDDPETQRLIEKYMDKTINVLAGNESIDTIEVKEDIINYLKENKETISKISGEELTDAKINELEKELEKEDIDQKLKQSMNNTKNEMPSIANDIIEVYSYFNSNEFRFILVISIVICIILIALLQKSFYKWIKTLAESVIVNGVLAIVVSLVVMFIVTTVSPLKSFNMNNLLIPGIIMTVSGIIVVIVYNILTKKKVDEEIEVS